MKALTVVPKGWSTYKVAKLFSDINLQVAAWDTDSPSFQIPGRWQSNSFEQPRRGMISDPLLWGSPEEVDREVLVFPY